MKLLLLMKFKLIYEIVPWHIILSDNSCRCFIQIILRDSRRCNTHCASKLASVRGPPFVVQHNEGAGNVFLMLISYQSNICAAYWQMTLCLDPEGHII